MCTGRNRVLVTSISVVCLAGAWLSGCAGQHPATPGSAATVAEMASRQLPEVSRLASDASDEYTKDQQGADFATDLAWQACTAQGGKVELDPTAPADELAFGIYRLLFNPDKPQLGFDWNRIPPASGQGWLALANWGSGSWDIVPINGGNAVDLGADTPYADGDSHCLAAVFLYGGMPRTLVSIGFPLADASLTYPIVDTGQNISSNAGGTQIIEQPGQPFFGQDARQFGNQPSFTDNGDGTVTDNVTELTWTQELPVEKLSWDDANGYANSLVLGGHDDWRMPSIKELYSLIDYRGYTGHAADDSIPYIDDNFFEFVYGDPDAGERPIDVQCWSSTEYVSTTMAGAETVFGVNFADGRIKGYPKYDPVSSEPTEMFFRCVRGNPAYGINDFFDNGDGTITDLATGLMWMQVDSGALGAGSGGDGRMNWEDALAWADGLDYAGYQDWHLPSIKELQSLLDYSHSPDTTASAAIDPLFSCTSYVDGNGLTDYRYYWSNTTHFEFGSEGTYACYGSFGEALGWIQIPPDSGNYFLYDVHGAGAQRSDPKDGDPGAEEFKHGHGPQGDVIGILDLARCVRYP